jgi:biotin carboxyl carrier protein
MADLQDLAATKARIDAIEAEIAAQQQNFEESIRELRAEHDNLTREYTDGLRAELARLQPSRRGRASSDGESAARAPRGSRPRPDAGAVLAAIERAQEAISVERMRELANVPGSVSSNTMSTLLRRLVEEGQVVREGQRRGTRYRIR